MALLGVYLLAYLRSPLSAGVRSYKVNDTLVNWACAAAVIAVLAWMGARNKRQGWKRERQDLVADVRDLWAEFGSKAPASSRECRPLGQITSDIPTADACDDLARLDAALRRLGRGQTIDTQNVPEPTREHRTV
jgi:hypothetical protein